MAEDISKNISSPVSNPSYEAGDLSLLAGIDLPIRDESGFAFVDENNETVPGVDWNIPSSVQEEPARQDVTFPPSPTSPDPVLPSIARQAVTQSIPVQKNPPPAAPLPAEPVFVPSRSDVSRPETVRPSFTPQSVPTPSPSQSSAALSSYRPFVESDHHPHPLLRKTHPEMSSRQQESARKPTRSVRQVPPTPTVGQGVHLDRYAEDEIKKYLAVTRGVGVGVPELPREVRRMAAAARAATAASVATSSPTPAPSVGKATNDPLSLIIEKIIAQAHLVFEDALQRSRFVTLVRSRLRDVRDKFELADGLMRSEKIGGLGYPEHKANEIAELVEEEALYYLGIKEKKSAIQKTPVSRPVLAVPAASIPSPSTQVQAAAPLASTIPKPAPTYRSAVLEQLVDLQKVHQTATVHQKKSVQSRTVLRPQSAKTSSPQRRAATFPQVIRPTISTDNRPTMSDVQQPQMVRKIDIMGPIDELARMTLVNFRRLGVTAEMRAQKIREKVELLEQDSFALRSQGVEAWKNSEVNRFYLTLGQESIVQGSPVADVIRRKENAEQPTLSLEEFNSIADLNKSLRY